MGYALFLVLAAVSTLVETVKNRKKPKKPVAPPATDTSRHMLAALSVAGNAKTLTAGNTPGPAE